MAKIELETLVDRVYGEDEQKPVEIQKEDKAENCYTFTVLNEDHTLGNMLTDQLLTESRIRFAGYRIEHPTKDVIKIRVQSETQIDKPVELIDHAVEELKSKLSSLSTLFREACRNYDEKSQN